MRNFALRSVRNQGGAALLVALLILLILTLIGVSGALGSLMGERMASDAKQRTDALFAAETGVSRAITRLSADDHAVSCSDGMLTGQVSAASGGYYEVDCQSIEPAQLGFCGPPYEGCYRVLSTGTVRTPQGDIVASRYVQARVGVPEGLTFDGVANAAVTCFGVDDECTITSGGSPGGIDGRNYGLPDQFDCQGVGCRSSLDPTRNADGSVDEAGAIVWGDGSITGGTNQFQGDPGQTINADPLEAEQAKDAWVDAWDELLEALGDPVLLSEELTHTSQLGSRTDPQFSHLKAGSEVADDLSGAGVLLVDPDVSFLGTMTFEGLVILMPGASLHAGNATFYGALVALDGADINLSGNAQIRFSSEALENAGELLGRGEADVLSWRQL